MHDRLRQRRAEPRDAPPEKRLFHVVAACLWYRMRTMHTASTALLDALTTAGVSYVFANLGSDHPAILEAFAVAAAEGRTVPELITCPAEMVALSAAQGFAQVTGRAQAVLVLSLIHISEPTRLLSISYAVFCLKK